MPGYKQLTNSRFKLDFFEPPGTFLQGLEYDEKLKQFQEFHNLKFSHNFELFITSIRALHLLAFAQVVQYGETLKQLQTTDLLEKHELDFFFHTLKFLSSPNLSNKNHIQRLKHSAYCQLIKYLAASVESNLLCMMVIHLLNINPMGTALNGLYLILIESALEGLQKSLRVSFENKPLDLKLILNYITEGLIHQLTQPSTWPELIKSSISNSYEFVKTNTNFFYHKLTSSLPDLKQTVANFLR